MKSVVSSASFGFDGNSLSYTKRCRIYLNFVQRWAEEELKCWIQEAIFLLLDRQSRHTITK